MDTSPSNNPYAPPAAALPEFGPLPELKARARILRWLLLAHYPYFGVYLVLRVLWLTGVSDFGAAGSAGAKSLPWRVFVGLTGLLGLATAIAFLQWMHSAYVRATRGVAYSRFTPGFSVACWCIPIANFVVPLLAMRHLWQLSRRGADWREEQPPSYVLAWWSAWTGSALVTLGAMGALFGKYGPRFGSSPGVHAPWYVALGLLSTLLSTWALVLVLRLVRDITAMQRERLGVD
jgi:hypothetical protein